MRVLRKWLHGDAKQHYKRDLVAIFQHVLLMQNFVSHTNIFVKTVCVISANLLISKALSIQYV